MSQVKLGNKNIPFIYQGNELLYPNPIKDGLVLWYDFKGMKNNDVTNNVARDLSGNGNNGVLKNFVYDSGSGYNDGMHFDGVDDFVSIPQNPLAYQGKEKQKWTVSILATIKDSYTSNKLLKGINNGLEVRISGGVYKALNFIGSTSRLYLYSNSIVPVNEKCHITYSYNYVNKKNRIYINGVLDSELIIDDSKDKLEGMLSVLELSPNRDNVIHSLQIYNRILSEQEIQHNYQLEKERWGL